MQNSVEKSEIGKLIAAFGIPGSGKSSTTREIGKLLGIQTFHEPEENEWGMAVKMRETIGKFTAIMWFRSMRLPGLFEADLLRQAGKMAMVDSYYDKLFFEYYNKPGIEWLFDDNDLYHDEMMAISKKDSRLLPDADIIIFFKLSEQMWKEFIGGRKRELDRDADFLKSFRLQEIFIDVVEKYAKRTNCHLIVHEQSNSSPEIEAAKIISKINDLT